MNNINLTPVVKNLLIINVLFFLATWVFDQTGLISLSDVLSVHYFNSPNFRVWQPITYMFMHANFEHLFSNMFGLLIFGGLIERHYGAKRFINFYVITGLGAVFLQWCVQAFELYQLTGAIVYHGEISLELLAKRQFDPELFTMAQAGKLYGIYFGSLVGASGAIFGISVAFAMLYPNLEMMMMFIPVPIKAKYLVGGYVIMEFYSGLQPIEGDSVAHFAHIGGALIGFVLVKFWGNKGNYYDYYE